MRIRLPMLVLAVLMLAIVSAAGASAQGAPTAKQSADADAARKAAEEAERDSAFVSDREHHAAYEQKDILIRLERTPCYGSCPVYTVTILGDRSATLVAPGMKANGYSCCDRVKRTTLSAADYDGIVKQIETMGFFKLQEDYSAPVTDVSGVKITVIAPYGVHRVWRYAVPCESEYRKIRGPDKRPTIPVNRADGRTVTIEDPGRYGYLDRVSPPPDSLCKLELMIDQLTGSEQWARQMQAPEGHSDKASH